MAGMTDTATPRTPTAPSVATVEGHPDDIAAITCIIGDTEVAFNTNDAELLAEHFAADGEGVAVTGARLSGRDQILESGRQLLAGPLADQYARYVIDEIRFVRPDVALVRKLAWATDADGTDLDVGHAMTALYVMVKDGDRWWIAARQNALTPSND